MSAVRGLVIGAVFALVLGLVLADQPAKGPASARLYQCCGDPTSLTEGFLCTTRGDMRVYMTTKRHLCVSDPLDSRPPVYTQFVDETPWQPAPHQPQLFRRESWAWRTDAGELLCPQHSDSDGLDLR